MSSSLFLEEFEDFSSNADNMIEKVSIYTESLYREYLISKEQSELKVLTESGTEEDLTILYEAAEKSVKGKFGAALQKLLNILIEYKNKIVETIRNKYISVKGTNLIKKLEKLIKSNSKISNLTIEISDASFLESEYEKLIDQCHKLGSKASSISSDESLKSMEDEAGKLEEASIKIRKEYEKIKKKISLSSAIDFFKSLIDKAQKEVVNKDIFTKIKENASILKERILTKINILISTLKKKIMESRLRCIGEIISKIKSVIKNKGKDFKEKEDIKESVEDYEGIFINLFESVYNESYNG